MSDVEDWKARAVTLEWKLETILKKLEEMHQPSPRAYSRADAAKLLGVSPSTVKKLIGNGTIKTMQYPGMRRRLISSLEISRLTTPKSFLPKLDMPAPIKARAQYDAKAEADALRLALKARHRPKRGA